MVCNGHLIIPYHYEDGNLGYVTYFVFDAVDHISISFTDNPSDKEFSFGGYDTTGTIFFGRLDYSDPLRTQLRKKCPYNYIMAKAAYVEDPDWCKAMDTYVRQYLRVTKLNKILTRD